MKKIFHITTKELWAKAQKDGVYSHPSLEQEGFIHASFANQVQSTLQKHFKGEENLLMLELNCEQIQSQLKIEDLYRSGIEFPHIYSNIPLSAIVSVEEL